MVVAENDKTSGISPRNEIPDSWAKTGRCPACAALPLQVVHLPDSPDYLLCPKCELSFEVASNVGRIRVKNVPDGLGFAETELRFRWVEPGLLRTLLENRSSMMQQKMTLEPPKTMPDDEVWARMMSLYRLGNKPKEIEFILMRAGATHEQAEAAFARLKQRARQDASQQSRNYALVGGIASVLVVLLLAGWFVTMGRIGAQLEEGMADAKATSKPVLPLQALDALPDAVKPEFLKSGPAQVSYSGPASSRCPVNSQDAAKLFGGKSNIWQRAKQAGAWQMIDTGSPSTIRIPAGMYAGYIDNKSFMFSSVDGPATIYNVNFIVIMCE